MFNRKKKRLQQLDASFGNVKTENYPFPLIRRFYDRNQDQVFQKISEQTCNDLDFDLFFAFADRTHSSIGQQSLYNQLRTIKSRTAQFEAQEEIIQTFKSNPKTRIQAQYELSKLNSRKAYYISDLFQAEPFKKPKWSFIIPFLTLLVASSIVLSFFWSQFTLILMLLLPIHVIIHFSLKRSVSVFIDSIPQLLVLSSVAKKLLQLKVSKEPENVRASFKTLNAIKRRMSFFKLDQKLDSDLEAAYWYLIELIKIIFLLEPLLLFGSAQRIEDKKKDIKVVFDYVSSIDIALSAYGLRTSTPTYCIPEIKTKGNISATAISHPLIIDCTPNNIEIRDKSFLLTGSNMSGKTTLMRTIGLNHLCALTLNTAFAKHFSIPYCKLFTMIRVADDLMESTSYFLKELEIVKSIIDDDSTTKNLILLDELFKGTNTTERIASANSVLKYLHKKPNFVFVASHDLELSEQLEEQFDTYHLGETVKAQNIIFDYTLAPGNPVSGNAIELMRINNFPTEIINQARKLVS